MRGGTGERLKEGGTDEVAERGLREGDRTEEGLRKGGAEGEKAEWNADEAERGLRERGLQERKSEKGLRKRRLWKGGGGGTWEDGRDNWRA